MTDPQSPWRPSRRTPLRQFMRTETGSAVILAAAAVAGLVWSNVAPSGFEAFWGTRLSASVGTAALQLNLREFVNSGLMAFFFLVVGMEARRELDMGELRVRSRRSARSRWRARACPTGSDRSC